MRQADHVRFAPLDHLQPADPILIAKRAGLAGPKPLARYSSNSSADKPIHQQPGLGRANGRLSFGPGPNAQAAIDMMHLSAERREHSPGVGHVGRFAQNLAGALDNSVAGDDHARGTRATTSTAFW